MTHEQANMQGRRIMIVEDDAVIANDIRLCLLKLGYSVSCVVDTGEEAARRAVLDEPDLTLMGIVLNGRMTGIDAAYHIRKATGSPVVFLTAHGTDEHLELAQFSEPYGYILKPFTEDDLRIGVRLALHRADLERRLRQSEERFRGICAASQDAVVLMDAGGCIAYWNPAAEKIFGFGEREALGKELHALIAPAEDLAASRQGVSVFGKTGNGPVVNRITELMAVRKNGELFPVELSVSCVEMDGQFHAVGIARDRSVHRNLEESLAASRTSFNNIVESTTDGIVVIDSNRVVRYLNRAAEDIFGRTRDELQGKEFPVPLVQNEAMEINTLRPEGESGFAELRAIETSWEGTAACLALIRDITEQKHAQDAQQQLTMHLEEANRSLQALVDIDPLTGLLNRRGLEKMLAKEVSRGRRNGAMPAVIFLDCDDFKKINDTMGHSVGDIVLKAVADRIGESARENDHLSRIGGDEFLVLLPDTRPAEASLVAERIRLGISNIDLGSGSDRVRLTVSLGVLSLPYETSSVEEVIVQARMPLQQSKTIGKNVVSMADAGPEGVVGVVGAAADMMQRLVKGDCLFAMAQPIVDLSDESIIGYEMLSRSDVEAFTMPNDFFRFCQENDMLPYVDLRCMKKCIDTALLLDPAFRIHVNLFPSTLVSVTTDRVLGLFELDGPPRTFCVELNEQQFIGDPDYLRQYVVLFKKAGILVAMDDVGFGRSSIESLILLEPDLVKIDRRFIDGISKDVRKRLSLHRMMKLITAIGPTLVAEGVETVEDMHVLKDLGVKYAQGYLWGRPAMVHAAGADTGSPEADGDRTPSSAPHEEDPRDG